MNHTPWRHRVAQVGALLLAGCTQPSAIDGFAGYVDAEYVRLSAPEAGWLQHLPVQRGQRVRAGELLFTLDDSLQKAALAEAEASLRKARADLADLHKGARPEEIRAIEAQLAEAEATRELAELQLRRQEQLAERGVASEQILDQARAVLKQAEARCLRVQADLATARLPTRADRIAAGEAAVEAAVAARDRAAAQLERRRVQSPTDGLVDDVLRRAGEWVPASGTVVSLLPPDGAKVVFFVPEGQRSTLHHGDVVEIECSGCPAGLTAHISRIATEAEFTPPVIYSRETRAKLLWRMEAVLDAGNDGPTPGQPVTVRVAR